MFETDTDGIHVEQTSSESAEKTYSGKGDPFLEGLGWSGTDADTDESFPVFSTESDDTDEEETDEEETVSAKSTPAEEAAKPADEDAETEYTVTYKGKVQKVTRTQKQLIADIQRSMDYDSVRNERDALKADADGAKEGLAVIDYFAEQNGMTRAEYIAFCNKTAGRGSESDVLESVKQQYPDIDDAAAKEIAAARMQAQQARAAAAEDSKLQALIDELATEYPDIKDIDSLPDDAKAAIAEGKTPLEAMRQHELADSRRRLSEAAKEIEALKKQIKTHQSAPGRVDNNAPGEGYDPFLAGLKAGGEYI